MVEGGEVFAGQKERGSGGVQGRDREASASEACSMKLINCPRAKHHGHQSFQNGKKERWKEGKRREAVERSTHRGSGSRSGGGEEDLREEMDGGLK